MVCCRWIAADGARAAITFSLFVGDQRIEACTHARVVQSGGRPLRVFYAFYQRMIPIAHALYDVYIDEIKREGLIR
jgi:hypothetical protein